VFKECEICGTTGQKSSEFDVQTVKCSVCGEYKLNSNEKRLSLETFQKVRLSGWVREQNAVGVTPLVDKQILRQVLAMRLPNYRERANRALAELAVRFPSLQRPTSKQLAVSDPKLWAVSYCADGDEARQLLDILEAENSIESLGTTRTDFRLTAKGLLAVDDMAARSNPSAQAFIAMSFDPSMTDAWLRGFDPAIRSAGFRPMRIDKEHYVGGIADRIMAEIRKSRFVVADYTLKNNGVYFEAGFALGLGLTVIPTCRSDEIAGLHFDIRHLNTLPWANAEELVDGLATRIRGVVGKGPDVAD
jgi:hypothetical protein